MAGHIRTGINFKSSKVIQVTFLMFVHGPTTMETICTVFSVNVNLNNYITNSL